MKKSSKTNRCGGFTLVEILVVVAIIGILASILIVRLAGKTDKARVATARAQLSQIEGAVLEFKNDTGRLPQTFDELVSNPGGLKGYDPGGYLKAIPKDPWRNDYTYRVTGRSFVVTCLGADGREGGEGYDADLSTDNQ